MAILVLLLDKDVRLKHSNKFAEILILMYTLHSSLFGLQLNFCLDYCLFMCALHLQQTHTDKTWPIDRTCNSIRKSNNKLKQRPFLTK